MWNGFTCSTGHTLTPGQPPPGLDYLPASPHHSPTTGLDHRLHHSEHPRRTPGGFAGLASPDSALALHNGYRNINRLSIDYACRPRLRPRLTLADQLDPGTLSQSAQEFPTLVSLLMPAFSLAYHPQLVSTAASPGTRRSPTHHNPR